MRAVRPFWLDPAPLRAAITRACETTGAEVIHAHYASTIGQVSAAAAAALGLPFVAEIRFDLAGAVMSETVRAPVPLLERGLRRWFDRHCAAADAVVVASHSLGTLVARTFPGVADRLTVVPNGADIRDFHPGAAPESLRRSLGLDGRFVVGTTANMLRFEGLDLLLDAVEMLRDRLPQLHVLLVGGGTQRAALERKALARRLPVTFAGPVPRTDVAEWYRLFDLFVVPRRDGAITRYASPLKLIEAMATGLPCVASAVGDVPELLGGGRGWLVSPGRVPELCDAIAALALDDSRRCATGRAARAGAESAMTWEGTAAVYRDVYERARARHQQQRAH